jgi:hypothetical protein
MVKEGGKFIARKRMIMVGQSYSEKIEVRSGLKMGDVLITEGYQNLYEGQVVTTVAG